MKNSRSLFLIALLTSLIIYSCKKNEEDDVPQLSKTQLLTANDWIYTNMVAAPPLDTLELWLQQDDCIKDNFYSFSSDGNGTFNENSKKCEPTDPQTESFTWQWLNNETELQMIQSGDTILIKEVNLISNKMTGKKIDSFFGYISITLEGK